MKTKRLIALAVAVMLVLGLLCVPAAAKEPTNYLTHTWEAVFFDGTLEETEEEGVKVYTYTPGAKQPWFSAQLSIYDDLKALAQGKEFIEVVLYVEIRGVFSKGEGTASCDSLLRAVNPKTNSYAYSDAEVANWNGEGNTWDELYDEAAEGEGIFTISNTNNMYNLMPMGISLESGEWTVFESEPIYIPTSSLDDTLFGDWVWCMHQISYDSNLSGLQFRNTAIYDYNEPGPTAAPTEAPTEAAVDNTPEPEVTAAVTAAPTSQSAATEAAPAATEANGSNSGDNKGVNPGVIAAIIGGVVVVAAVIAGVVISKKKKGGKK